VNYAGGPSHPQNNVSADDLPKNVARSLNQGSCVMSMDFHPIQQTVLLGMYGCNSQWCGANIMEMIWVFFGAISEH
jgi:hypothetical protein